MKKFFTIVAAALMVPTMLFSMDLTTLNKYVDKNLVAVGNGCSGTIVDPTERIVLTAYHCVTSAIKQVEEVEKDIDGRPVLDKEDKPKTKKRVEIKKVPVSQTFFNEETGDPEVMKYTSDIIGRDAKLDVAILKMDQKMGPINMPLQENISYIPLATEDYNYQRGATIWHVGNPIGKWGTVTKGIISSYRDIRYELKDYYSNSYLIQYDGGVARGSSGGSLYDDNGTYIGTTTSVYLDNGIPAYFMGLFIPMSDFYEVAEKNCIQLGSLELPEKCAPKGKNEQ